MKYHVLAMCTLQLDDRLSLACDLLTSCLRGNAGALRRQLPRLVPLITSLMSSPLAAPRLAAIFVALGDAAFESRDKYLGMTLSPLLPDVSALSMSSEQRHHQQKQ